MMRLDRRAVGAGLIGGVLIMGLVSSCMGEDASLQDAPPSATADGGSSNDTSTPPITVDAAEAACPPSVLLCDDFELGDFRRWSAPPVEEAPSSLRIDELGPPRRGKSGLHFSTKKNEVDGSVVRTMAGVTSKPFPAVTEGSLAVRFYMLAPSVPSQSTTFFWFSKGAADAAVSVLYADGGNWAAQSVAGTIGTGTFAPSIVPIAVNRWLCVEWVVDVGTAGRQQIFLDGSPEPILTSDMNTLGGAENGYTIGSLLMNNQGRATQDLFFDDVAMTTFPTRATGPRIGCLP